jgi:tetratricopeptide (TPR) repeat protein
MKCFSYDPSNLQSLYYAGVAKNELKQYVDCKSIWETVLEKDSTYSYAHYSYAKLMFEQFKDTYKAKYHYKQFTKFNKTDCNSWFFISEFYKKYGTKEEFVEIKEEAKKLFPYTSFNNKFQTSVSL